MDAERHLMCSLFAKWWYKVTCIRLKLAQVLRLLRAYRDEAVNI
jgi:hypothetical protein